MPTAWPRPKERTEPAKPKLPAAPDNTNQTIFDAPVQLSPPIKATGQLWSMLQGMEEPYNWTLPPLWMRYAPGNLPKRLQATLYRDTCTSILSATLLKIAKLWSQAMCLSTEEHTYGLDFSYKQWNCVVSRRVDATGENHIKQSKPISER